MSLLLRRATVQTNTTTFRNNLFLSRWRHSGPSSSIRHAPRPQQRSISYATVSLIAFSSIAAYTLGSIYPPNTLTLLFPRVAPPPPNDQSSPEVVKYIQDLENTLQNLPVLQKHRAEGGWYETRPYAHFPPERAVNNLSAGTLRGAGRIALPPLARVREDESEAFTIIHLGRALCGHDGIIHGGLIATVMDENLARIAISNFPERVGVTATLSVHYRAPTSADQFVVIKTRLDELRGRKAFVSARMEDLNGKLLVEAEATFVQPRYAKLLNTTAVRKAMGEPPKAGEGHQRKEPVLLVDAEEAARKRDREA